jgi:hypothetical protein
MLFLQATPNLVNLYRLHHRILRISHDLTALVNGRTMLFLTLVALTATTCTISLQPHALSVSV